MVIAGAGGGVGASVAFNLLLSALDCELVLLDSRREMLLSHLWDLEQVLEQARHRQRARGHRRGRRGCRRAGA